MSQNALPTTVNHRRFVNDEFSGRASLERESPGKSGAESVRKTSNIFINLIFVQQVIVFSKSISSAKRFAWKIPVAALAQSRAASALTCSPTATGIFESKS
jgi:hypothetical protein